MPGEDAAKLVYVKVGLLRSPVSLGSLRQPLPEYVMLLIRGSDAGVSATAREDGSIAAKRTPNLDRFPIVIASFRLAALLLR